MKFPRPKCLSTSGPRKALPLSCSRNPSARGDRSSLDHRHRRAATGPMSAASRSGPTSSLQGGGQQLLGSDVSGLRRRDHSLHPTLQHPKRVQGRAVGDREGRAVAWQTYIIRLTSEG